MTAWEWAAVLIYGTAWLAASWWINWDHRRRWQKMHSAHAERMAEIMRDTP